MLLGEMVEHGPTADVFLSPKDQRTADYVEGRYG
jgi:phosphate transport system ATP-binding protein